MDITVRHNYENPTVLCFPSIHLFIRGGTDGGGGVSGGKFNETLTGYIGELYQCMAYGYKYHPTGSPMGIDPRPAVGNKM